MARKPKSQPEDGPTKGHNLKEIHAVIRDAAKCIIELKAKKAAIQEQITEAKAKVKGQGISMVDFNVALRLHELDAEDRNESLTSLQIAFEALGIGEQGDLFPEKKGDDDPRPAFLRGKHEETETGALN